MGGNSGNVGGYPKKVYISQKKKKAEGRNSRVEGGKGVSGCREKKERVGVG